MTWSGSRGPHTDTDCKYHYGSVAVMVGVRSVNMLDAWCLGYCICLLIRGFIKGLCIETHIMVCGCVCWHRYVLCAVLGDCIGVYLCFSEDKHIGM